jgi:hypothetical protein
MGTWPRTSVRGNQANATFAPAVPVAEPTTPDNLVLVTPPGGGQAVLIGPPDQIEAAAGALGAASVYPITPPMPPDLPPAPGAGAPPVPKKGPAPAGPAPDPDPKFDTAAALFAAKPASVSALVQRMGEVLYGEEVSAAARGKIEKFLLGDKKAPTAKDMEAGDFRRKTREALHALMCLPEYQLD